MKQIKLTDGSLTTVDDDTYEWASKYEWRNQHGYAMLGRNSPQHLLSKSLHRQVMGNPSKKHVHHRNRDRLDNRRANLQALSADDHLEAHGKKPQQKCSLPQQARSHPGHDDARLKMFQKHAKGFQEFLGEDEALLIRGDGSIELYRP